MNKINILITASGGDIGGNIINILSNYQDSNISIIGIDIKEQIFNSDKIDKFYQVQRTDHPLYQQELIQIVKENNIHLILPISENEIIWFNNHRDIFLDSKIKVLVNNTKILDTFLNKLDTAVELNNIGVSTPKTIPLNVYVNQLSFPLILKSTYSVKGKDIYTIRDQQQLDYLKTSLLNHDDYIIQQYIGSIEEEYTTTVYQDNDKFEVITFKRALTGGMTSFATIYTENVLIDHAKKIAKAFELNGSINIQSRRVGDEFYIFEINPRFSSTVFIRDYFGFQDVVWWINSSLTKQIFDLQNSPVQHSGSAILGYQYKFLTMENSYENR